MRELQFDTAIARRVIGPRGTTCRALEKEFNVDIQVDSRTGLVKVAGLNEADLDAASARINELSEPLKTGEVYDAVIDSVKNFGVFVSFNGHSGLVHVSGPSAQC